MSKTIDEKVVEMRFDNKHFEANVSTTLSTLDKLKAKLNLTGASKGLEEVNKASKKVDFSHMESSLAALEKRFSTTGIVGMTVIQNLTNAAMGFAKKLSSFSIGGILEGGKSRATKIENARFQIKGLLRDYEDAQKRLDDIMADVNYGVESTAYGLDAAASVAAQLVASGMQAGDGMKAALRGISGVAAMTNSTYEDIGKIYTTVAGNGRLMGDQLLQLSSRGMNAAAVLAKSLGKTEAEVREMTSKGKISFEMFSKAMDDAFGEHAKDANKTLNGVISNIKAALAKIGADFYGPLIAENSPLVLFLNSVRERINEIRKTLAPITKEVTDRINNFITALNKLFTDKNLFGYNPLANMAEKIQSIKDVLNGATAPIKKAAEVFDKAGHSLQDYEKLVDEIIYGKWKNQPVRQQLLEEAGWNYYKAQNMVNEKLGNSFRYADEYVQATEQATTSTAELAVEVENLSDEQMRNMGFTEEQIEAFNELKKMAKKTGIPIKELIELISTKDGKDDSVFSTRYLLLNSLKNIGFTLVSIFKSIGKAFGEVFNASPEGLFDLIAAFHKLTALLRDRVEKNAEKLTSTFKGLFSIIHLITTIVGGAFKLGLKIVNKILESFGLSLLDVTAIIGEAIYRFEQWITSNETIVSIGKAFVEVLVAIIKYVIAIVGAIKDWVAQNEAIMSFVNKVKTAFDKLGGSMDSWIQGLKETDNIPKYIFEGLINGIKNYGPKVWDAIVQMAQGIVTSICDVLQIHSPSKVMFAIGGFIIAGLVGGMLSESGNVWEVVQTIGSRIAEFFKGLNIGNIIAVGLSAGIIVTVKKMLDIVDKLTAPLVGLGNLMTGLGNALSGIGAAAVDFGKSMKYQGIAAIIKSIAISIGILAAALWVLGQMPQDQLKQGAIALGALGVALAVFIGLVAALSKRLSTVKMPDMGKTLAVVLGVAIGMVIMSKALKNVAKIEPERMASSVIGLIACAAAMGLLIVALSKATSKINLVDDKSMKQLGKVFTRMAISLLLISVALRLMSKVETGDILKLGGVILGLVSLLAAIGLINKFSAGSLDNAAETIKAVGIALLLLTITMKIAGGLTTQDFLNGIKVVGVFCLLLVAMMGISKLFKGTEMVKVTGSILMAAAAIAALAIVVKLLGNLEPEQMKKGLICVSILSALVAGLILVSKQSGSIHGTTLLGVAAVLVAMGAAVWLLGQLDPEKAKNGLVCVGFLTLFIDTLLLSAKNFAPGENAAKVLTRLIVALALLAVALVALSFIEPQRLMSAAGSLGAVMLALAAVIYATGKLKVDGKAMATLGIITAVIGAMAGIIYLLSTFTDPNAAIKASVGLSLLTISMAGVMVALSKLNVSAKDAAKGALALTAMAVPLLAFVGVLKVMDMAQLSDSTLSNVMTLIILAGAMTLLLAALTLIGTIGNIGQMLSGVLGLTAMALPLWLFVLVLKSMNGVDNAISKVDALVKLCTAMTLLLIPLTILGAIYIASAGIAAGATLAGILALCAMAIPLAIFIGVLKGMNDIENATENINAMTTMMEKMTDCLVKLSLVAPLALMADAALFGLIGAIVTIGVLATAVGAIMDKFPQLQDFLNKGLPVLEQIALSIGKIIGNVVAGFMNSVAEELPHTATKLSEFAINAMPFIAIMSTVTDRVGQGVKTMAGAILALTGANLLDGIASFLAGGQSFGRLGGELSKFATDAKPFIDIVGSVDPAVMEGAKNMADAVLSFTKGNFWDTITGWLAGDSDIGEFGAKLAPLGSGLRQFVDNLGNFTDDQITTVNAGCEALKSIADAAEELPNEGGVAAFFAGENDLAVFADKLPKAGEGIRNFVSELTKDGNFDQGKIDTVKAGCEALKTIAEVASELPNEGGVAAFFAGDNDIEKFAGKLGKVAEGIRGFVWELQKDNVITKDSIDKINAVNNIMWAVADLGKINLGDTSGKLEELGARLGSFGNKITEYVKGINTVSMDDLNASKEKIDKIIEIANTLAAVSSEPIESLGEKLKNFATDAIKKFVDGLNDAKPKEDAVNAIKNLIDEIIKGMKDKEPDVEKGSKAVVEVAITALKNSDISGAEEAGKNFVEGFAKGINNNLYMARDAGSAVGKKALEAAKASIDSHSPSKETYKLGTFFDQGFINGIKSLEDKIYSETYGVGDKARLGLGRAIKAVSNLISDGIDDEFTIRPVLDLSEVESGAAGLNSLFGTPSVGVSANLNAISSGMRQYRQNGGENVVDAIDKLGKNLGNVSGDTYNINGITYDDGTEISEAVQTLVRAARIERRT